MTTMKHPDSPDPIEVEADRVSLFAASGWVVVKDKPKAEVPKVKK